MLWAISGGAQELLCLNAQDLLLWEGWTTQCWRSNPVLLHAKYALQPIDLSLCLRSALLVVVVMVVGVCFGPYSALLRGVFKMKKYLGGWGCSLAISCFCEALASIPGLNKSKQIVLNSE